MSHVDIIRMEGPCVSAKAERAMLREHPAVLIEWTDVFQNPVRVLGTLLAKFSRIMLGIPAERTNNMRAGKFVRSTWVLTVAALIWSQPAQVQAADGSDISQEVQTEPIRQLIGGTATDWHPAIGQLVRTVEPRGYCTATLIHPRYILTAAHCFGHVDQYPGRYEFVFSSYAGQRTRVGLEAVKVFSPHGNGVEKWQYDSDLTPPIGFTNMPDDYGSDDVAIARLNRAVSADKAYPLNIAFEGPQTGDTVTMFGYGCTSLRDSGGYKHYYTFTYTRTTKSLSLGGGQLIGNQRVGALCEGDSGGPVVLGGPDDVFIWAVNSSSGFYNHFGSIVWFRDAIAEIMRRMDGRDWNQGVWRGGRRLLDPIILGEWEGPDRCRDLCNERGDCRAYTLSRNSDGAKECSLLSVPSGWLWSYDAESGIGNPGEESRSDRRGREYKTIAVANRDECRSLCSTSDDCKGFTYALVSSQLQSQSRCYLLKYTPYKVISDKKVADCPPPWGSPLAGEELSNSCYVSAVKRGLEWDIDRPGMDVMEAWTEYPNNPLSGRKTPEACQAICAQREECQAFTFVHANKVGDTTIRAKCYVKNGVPEPQFVPHKGLVSGVKGRDFLEE